MIPTAEEFARREYDDKSHIDEFVERQIDMKHALWMMKTFAKLHVKAAIKECIESAPSGSSTDTVSYEDVVECLKDCYPDKNIK